MGEALITEHLDLWTGAHTTKSTSGRGRSNKLELTGIKKLRELILELAVRGKLVAQDPSDEPAEVQLARIVEEKEQLVKEKKIKRQKDYPAISADEIDARLPIGWSWTSLGNISEIAPRNGPIDDETEVSFVPMPLVSTSYKGSHGSEARKWNEIKKGYTHFADGDIAIAKITPCFENGKAAVFSGLENGVGAGTTELHVARPIGETLDRLYILLYLKAPQFLLVGETKMTGSAGQKRVPKDYFAGNPLPLPPLAEQHRIVAKVDELMALCDRLESQQGDSIQAHQTLVETLLATLTDAADSDELAENWARLAAHFDTLFTTEHSIEQLKQTVLQLAVMGRLVAQDPSDEPASVLLERIATEKERLFKEKKIKKQKKLPAISIEDELVALPLGWQWVRLGELVSVMDAGWSPACPPDPSPAPEQWGVLKTTAVQTFQYHEHHNKILPADKEPRPQYEVKNGDILITRAGPKNRVGISCLVENTRPKLMISDKIIRFHLIEVGISGKFVSLCLNAGCTAEYLESAKSGMAESQMNISQDKLKLAPMPLVSISQQNRIVAKVDELMALCDQLKDRVQVAQALQCQLADAVVTEAVNPH